MNSKFINEYQKKLLLFNEFLGQIMNKQKRFPLKIFDAMEYSLFAGGKRLRPILLISAHEMVGGNLQESLPIACGIEMIHTYSLIHDDLPAMDNDDYRRGIPTNHKVFGEGIAVLAGDGLLNMGYEIMVSNTLKYPQKLKKHLEAINIIASASGVKGMIGGQVADLESEGKDYDSKTIKYIHEHKTGALISASLEAGIALENVKLEFKQAISNYGKRLGLAFQICDDILDVTGSLKKLGKRPGSDEKNKKATFIKQYGLENSKKMAANLVDEAVESLRPFGSKGEFLKDMAFYVLNRDK